jgi:hypothetical protein
MKGCLCVINYKIFRAQENSIYLAKVLGGYLMAAHQRLAFHKGCRPAALLYILRKIKLYIWTKVFLGVLKKIFIQILSLIFLKISVMAAAQQA